MRNLLRHFVFMGLALVWCLSASGDQGAFVGSKHSNKYHFPTCSIAKEIPSSDVVTFKSPEQAISGGFVPCSKCNPPRKAKYYVTSHNASVYHLPTCMMAQRIPVEDTIYLYSQESAEKSGYKPCQICITTTGPVNKKTDQSDQYHK